MARSLRSQGRLRLMGTSTAMPPLPRRCVTTVVQHMALLLSKHHLAYDRVFHKNPTHETMQLLLARFTQKWHMARSVPACSPRHVAFCQDGGIPSASTAVTAIKCRDQERPQDPPVSPTQPPTGLRGWLVPLCQCRSITHCVPRWSTMVVNKNNMVATAVTNHASPASCNTDSSSASCASSSPACSHCQCPTDSTRQPYASSRRTRYSA